MQVSSKLLAAGLIVGILITATLSVWAYIGKEDQWEFEGSLGNLNSLSSELQLFGASTTQGLTQSFISSEADNAKDNAQKEGDSIRSLSLSENMKDEQMQAVQFAESIASTSEKISTQ